MYKNKITKILSSKNFLTSLIVFVLFAIAGWELAPQSSKLFVRDATVKVIKDTQTDVATNTVLITSAPPVTIPDPVFYYVQITNGCAPYYESGECINLRSGPGVKYTSMAKLRTGIVLKVEKDKVQDSTGQMWYKIVSDKNVRYTDRIGAVAYVAVDDTSIAPIENIGDILLKSESSTTTKRIVVSISKEMLYAYDGDELYMQESVSTGLKSTPTPAGKFRVFKKTPSRYMQGPLPGVSEQVYDLPGVPWNLYFTSGGAVIHGAYWHDKFGQPWSHGCVNLSVENAKKLYLWADIGTTVTVQR